MRDRRVNFFSDVYWIRNFLVVNFKDGIDFKRFLFCIIFIWRGLYMEGLIFGILRFLVMKLVDSYNVLSTENLSQLNALVLITEQP